MTAFINGLGIIKPASSEPGANAGNVLLQVDELMLKEHIDARMGRRMSRVIKMGVSAAKLSLKDAGIAVPDAILVGTGLGCMEDTEKFLTELITNNEQLLTPTSFIQSTHNTVAGQIALMLKCHDTNFTYVHRGISFELALQDALMQIREGHPGNILVGGLDETTPDTFEILKRLGAGNTSAAGSAAFMFGEGAGFFMLSGTSTPHTYAKISQVQTLFDPATEHEVTNFITNTVLSTGIQISNLSLVIGGMNGGTAADNIYNHLQIGLLHEIPWTGFKHISGEYHTASAIGLSIAACILKKQRLPDDVITGNRSVREFKNILLYNHHKQNHSAIVIQAC